MRMLRTAECPGTARCAGMHMHAAELGAAVQRRKHLAGIEQALGVEGAFEPLLLVEVDLGEHRRHQVALLDADAVLAGQHAADLDAEPQDVGAERLGALEFARLVGVVEDERMQVAVAGVEHVGDAQAVFLRQLAHALRAPAAACARGMVPSMQIIVRRDAADRRERRLAAGPEQQPLLLRGRHPAASIAPQSRAISSTRVDQMIDLGRRAVELDDQQRLDVERIAGSGRSPRPRGSPGGPSSPCRPE